LFSWGSFNEILCRAPSPHPDVRLFHSTKRSIEPRDAVELIRGAQEGATVILQDADRYDRTLGKFLGALSADVGEDARLNAYASSEGRPGFPMHFDAHDVFILQVEGSKRWRVAPATDEHPLFFQKHHATERPPDDTIYLDTVLRRGQMLYVPRGHWHEAVAVDGPSLHLTLGLFRRTGISFLEWIVDELRDKPFFRESFPLAVGEYAGGASLASARFARRMLDEFAQMCSDESALLERYLSYGAAKQKDRAPYNFPAQLAGMAVLGDATARYRRCAHSLRLTVDSERELVVLVSPGRLLEFMPPAEALLRFALGGRVFSFAELLEASKLDSEDDVNDVLSTLVHEGIVRAEVP